MTTTTSILAPRWIIPVEPAQTVLEDHALVIKGHDIDAIVPLEQARRRYAKDVEITMLPDQALMPGLVNSHTHAAMTLMRGYADDKQLMDWLENYIWPAEGRWVDEDYVRDGTRLAIAEMLCGGTTCFNDMYFFPEVAAKVAQDAGIRAVVGMIMIDFPSRYASNAQEYLDKGLSLHDELRHSELVTTCFAPHAPYTVSDEPLARIATLADELGLAVHIHLHETAGEVEEHLSRHSVRPIERMSQLGLVGPRMMAVHMTQLMQGEIAALAQNDVKVVHCPESNLKLASGMCPVHELLQAGVNVSLGTDGAASNNDLDMLAEMRTAALLAKGVSGDPTAVPAHQAIEMATINGARTLGLDNRIGSLVAGKAADLISIDLGDMTTVPTFDPVSQIVYSASRNLVRNVWVNGQQMVRDGDLLVIDLQATIESARQWGHKIANAK